MNLNKIFLSVTLFSIILTSGCVPAIAPTDVCEFNIPVTELYPNNDFDYIDFFDFSIDIARENNFQPPVRYEKDRENKLIIFGDKNFSEMPGLRMVVYMWVENPLLEDDDKLCINYELLQREGSPFPDGLAREAIMNFKNDLEQKYKDRIEEKERIFKKFQTK